MLTFADHGSVVIHFVENGQIFFSSVRFGHEDKPWLARMEFADFEASVIRTEARLKEQRNA